MADQHRMYARPDGPSRAALARDAALARVTRTRRWVIAGSAALTAGFAALVSAVAPGKSLASKSPSSKSSARASAQPSATSSQLPAMPAPANPGDLGLQGPNQAPAPVPEQPQSIPSQPPPTAAPPAVSGGS
jgi:hypothetical protein